MLDIWGKLSVKTVMEKEGGKNCPTSSKKAREEKEIGFGIKKWERKGTKQTESGLTGGWKITTAH